MARRNERGSTGRKLATWAAIALVIIWAARDPAQAAALAHRILAAAASLAARLPHARSTTP